MSIRVARRAILPAGRRGVSVDTNGDQSRPSAREALRVARRVVVLIGEGLAAEEDLPEASDDEKTENSVITMLPEQMATIETFRRDPSRLWRWYLWRRQRITSAPRRTWPEALAELARRIDKLTVITENVDGLHGRIGVPALELHGNLWRTRCTGCGRVRDDIRTVYDELPPSCDHCGSLVRPDIVLFGESLDAALMERAYRSACAADVLVIMGAGNTGEPAASLAGYARENGALVVEIDVERTPVTGMVTVFLPGDVDAVMDALLAPGSMPDAGSESGV